MDESKHLSMILQCLSLPSSFVVVVVVLVVFFLSDTWTNAKTKKKKKTFGITKEPTARRERERESKRVREYVSKSYQKKRVVAKQSEEGETSTGKKTAKQPLRQITEGTVGR